MTDAEFSIKEYMTERFDGVDGRLDKLDARLETLEKKEAGRVGRNSFLANSLKTVGGLLAAILAALGIKSQVG
jgi:hypothetical protein